MADKLETLEMLIPRVNGAAYRYMGSHYVAPDDIADASKAPDHGLIRCGFRVYEILDWNSTQRAWKVRPFSCTLTEQQLQDLAAGIR